MAQRVLCSRCGNSWNITPPAKSVVACSKCKSQRIIIGFSIGTNMSEMQAWGTYLHQEESKCTTTTTEPVKVEEPPSIKSRFETIIE